MKVNEDTCVVQYNLADGTCIIAGVIDASSIYAGYVFDPCVLLFDHMFGSPPRLRKWFPFARDREAPIKLDTRHIIAACEVQQEMKDWYLKSLKTFDDDVKKYEALKRLDDYIDEGADVVTEEENQLDEMNADMNAEGELEELLAEFLSRPGKKGSVH